MIVSRTTLVMTLAMMTILIAMVEIKVEIKKERLRYKSFRGSCGDCDSGCSGRSEDSNDKCRKGQWRPHFSSNIGYDTSVRCLKKSIKKKKI